MQESVCQPPHSILRQHSTISTEGCAFALAILNQALWVVQIRNVQILPISPRPKVNGITDRPQSAGTGL